jgi:hypothetical protein
LRGAVDGRFKGWCPGPASTTVTVVALDIRVIPATGDRFGDISAVLCGLL